VAGDSVTLEELERDPHPVLASLREREPVAWLPALGGWLVTRHDLVLEAMRDPHTYTVDDPRFSTAQVIGPSMLSLDGDEHARHRAPFVGPFRAAAVRGRFESAAEGEAQRLIEGFIERGRVELRRSFAGPLAAAIMGRALGLLPEEVPSVLGWYDAIVAGVTAITAGEAVPDSARSAFGELRGRLLAVVGGDASVSLLGAAARDSELSEDQIVSNAAVLLFGGIETTEGMIANATLALLTHAGVLAEARRDVGYLDAVIDESLRLEPAAAVVDRYATRDASLGGTAIAAGDLVRLSISAANRDPGVFEDPDRFDPARSNLRRHLAFAHGPHVCVGVHLARLETRAALSTLVARLPNLRLDGDLPPAVTGLVFRKPARLDVVWGMR
jgi:cytochrome P450